MTTTDDAAVEPYTADDDFFPDKRPDGPLPARSWVQDREAARLKAQGYTLEEICEKFHLVDYRNGGWNLHKAAKSVQRGLAGVYKFTTDELRFQEMASLDEMERELWRTLRDKQLLVQQGRVIYVNDVPLEDKRFTLETMDRILKIKERRAKLLGLDAQIRISVEADQIGNEINAMIAMIAQLDSGVSSVSADVALPPAGGEAGSDD
jgi:hypothetical protein